MYEAVKTGDLYIIKNNGKDVPTVTGKLFVTRYEDLANAVAKDMNSYGPDPRSTGGRDSLVALLCSYCDFYHIGNEKLIKNMLKVCSPEYDELLYCRMFSPGLRLSKLIPNPPVSPAIFQIWNDCRSGRIPIHKIAITERMCEDNLQGRFLRFLEGCSFRQLMSIQLCRAVTTSVYIGYLLVSRSVSRADLATVIKDLMLNECLEQSGYYPDKISELIKFFDSALYFSGFPDEQV